jgi:transcriptional regulator with XRE-family HTH domain
MAEYDAALFWKRYKKLAKKDLPVILKTQIKQSTLSTWKNAKIFPRVDKAVQIAEALTTSVEYLVTGREKNQSTCTAAALEIALASDRLNDEGKWIILSVAKGLEAQFTKKS